MSYVIKAEVRDPKTTTFAFDRQKTMYGGKRIAAGDEVFVFASENDGGAGLIAVGVVTAAKAVARKAGVARQTPRVSVTVRRMALAKRRLGLRELKPHGDWDDRRPETELNFKLYRQATNKVAGISEEAAAFLRGFFGRRVAPGRAAGPVTPKRAASPAGEEHVQYHKDGSVWARGRKLGGELHGYWEWFRKDGVRMRSGWFDRGVQVGEWTTYDTRGNVYKVTRMKAR